MTQQVRMGLQNLPRWATVSWPSSFDARANHPQPPQYFASIAGNIAAAKVLKMAKSRRIRWLCPLFRQFCQLF